MKELFTRTNTGNVIFSWRSSTPEEVKLWESGIDSFTKDGTLYQMAVRDEADEVPGEHKQYVVSWTYECRATSPEDAINLASAVMLTEGHGGHTEFTVTDCATNVEYTLNKTF